MHEIDKEEDDYRGERKVDWSMASLYVTPCRRTYDLNCTDYLGRAQRSEKEPHLGVL